LGVCYEKAEDDDDDEMIDLFTPFLRLILLSHLSIMMMSLFSLSTHHYLPTIVKCNQSVNQLFSLSVDSVGSSLCRVFGEVKVS